MGEMTNAKQDGRRRAALRVQQKRRRDSRRWTIDGRWRSSSSLSNTRLRTISSTRNLHSTPWNQRFIFQDEDPNKTNSIHMRKAETCTDREENNSHIPRSTTSIDRYSSKQTPLDKSTTGTCHFSERADGELVTSYSRCEIAPSRVSKYSDSNVRTCHIGVSPFDMNKVQQALDAAQSDEDDGNNEPPIVNRHVAFSPLNHANLDAFEELLYTVEVEEELAHRELVFKSLSKKVDDPLHSDLAADETYSLDLNIDNDDELPMIKLQERQEEILNFVKNTRIFFTEKEKYLLKGGTLKYHEIVKM